ncbi:MAG: hypothetical protein WCK35_28310 [Chloroflexota bacterium]
MSNLVRFEPIREMLTLREAMNQLFDDSFIRPMSMSGGSTMPAPDLHQSQIIPFHPPLSHIPHNCCGMCFSIMLTLSK